MVSSTNAVKSTAKTAMKNNYLHCAACCTVFIFAALLAVCISDTVGIILNGFVAAFISVLLSVFLLAPLFLGLLRFFYRLIFGQCDDIIGIFYYFSSKKLYIHSLKFILLLFWKVFIVGFVLMLPAIAAQILAGNRIYELMGISTPLWASNIWMLPVFLKSAALVFLFFITLKYYLSPFLFVADGKMDTEEALHISRVISRRTSFDFFYLILSFILWILLSLLLIPIVFTLPYFVASYSVHCRFAVTQYNRTIGQINEEAPTYSAE